MFGGFSKLLRDARHGGVVRRADRLFANQLYGVGVAGNG